ncbi:MAG: hypothetical protein M5U29_08905 [Anaerolineae bacterium]|nr:hypothetical protein [Anaerolineae bacterium]
MVLVVTVLTIAGWVPGVIAALLVNVLAEGVERLRTMTRAKTR